MKNCVQFLIMRLNRLKYSSERIQVLTDLSVLLYPFKTNNHAKKAIAATQNRIRDVKILSRGEREGSEGESAFPLNGGTTLLMKIISATD